MNANKISKSEECLVYKNKYISLYDDKVRFPDGSLGTYLRFVWNAGYCVSIIPVMENGKIALINQYCYAIQGWSLQIPGGLGEIGMNPLEVAIKELEEELGGVAESIEQVFTWHSDPGIMQTPLHVFCAKGVKLEQSVSHEHSEVIGNIEFFEPEEFTRPHLLSRIKDPGSFASVMRYFYQR